MVKPLDPSLCTEITTWPHLTLVNPLLLQLLGLDIKSPQITLLSLHIHNTIRCAQPTTPMALTSLLALVLSILNTYLHLRCCCDVSRGSFIAAGEVRRLVSKKY